MMFVDRGRSALSTSLLVVGESPVALGIGVAVANIVDTGDADNKDEDEDEDDDEVLDERSTP